MIFQHRRQVALVVVLAAASVTGSLAQSQPQTPPQLSSVVYFRTLFANLTSPKLPAAQREAIMGIYKQQYGLNDQESSLLLSLAQSFNSAAISSESEAAAVYQASPGHSPSAPSIQALGSIAAALDQVALTLGQQLIAGVRPATAQVFNQALSGRH